MAGESVTLSAGKKQAAPRDQEWRRAAWTLYEIPERAVNVKLTAIAAASRRKDRVPRVPRHGVVFVFNGVRHSDLRVDYGRYLSY